MLLLDRSAEVTLVFRGLSVRYGVLCISTLRSAMLDGQWYLVQLYPVFTLLSHTTFVCLNTRYSPWCRLRITVGRDLDACDVCNRADIMH